MEILEQKNMILRLLSGPSVELAKEGEITIEKGENDEVYYTVDFEQLMILVVLPVENEKDTLFKFKHRVVDTAEVDWYWKLYLENFSSPEG